MTQEDPKRHRADEGNALHVVIIIHFFEPVEAATPLLVIVPSCVDIITTVSYSLAINATGPFRAEAVLAAEVPAVPWRADRARWKGQGRV